MKKRIFAAVIVLALAGISCRIPLGKQTAESTLPATEATSTTEVLPTPVAPTAEPAPLPTETPEPETGGSVPLNLHYLYYLDGMNAWGVAGVDGGGEIVVRSADGGRTWKQVSIPGIQSDASNMYVASAFMGDKDIWFVQSGQYDSFLPDYNVVFTRDGGNTWQSSQPLDTSVQLEFFTVTDLTFVDENTGWILAHVGAGMNHDYIIIYRTDDGGETWQKLLDPFNDSPGLQSCQKNSIWFSDGEHGWLTGTCNGVAPGVLLFKTTDGGSTWQKVVIPVPQGYEPLFDMETGYCGSLPMKSTEANVLIVRALCSQVDPQPESIYFEALSTDNGNSWEYTQPRPLSQMYAFHVEDEIDLTLADAWTKSVGGDEPYAVNVSPAWPGYGSAVFAPNAAHWYAFTTNEEKTNIAFSSDRGENWEVLNPQLVQ